MRKPTNYQLLEDMGEAHEAIHDVEMNPWCPIDRAHMKRAVRKFETKVTHG